MNTDYPMPTENRSSNTEMVSVPEPVVLPARKVHKKGNSPMQNAKNSAWNACLDEIAKLGPLYTHADPGEVERLRGEVRRLHEAGEFLDNVSQGIEDKLRAQLADLDALRSFADEAVSAAYEGGSFEGGDIQDMAVKHGLLRIESRSEECGEACACREYGFPAECYRKTSLLFARAGQSRASR